MIEAADVVVELETERKNSSRTEEVEAVASGAVAADEQAIDADSKDAHASGSSLASPVKHVDTQGGVREGPGLGSGWEVSRPVHGDERPWAALIERFVINLIRKHDDPWRETLRFLGVRKG